MVGFSRSAHFLQDVSDSEAVDRGGDAVSLALTGELTAETWLDPFTPKPPAQGWSALLSKEHRHPSNGPSDPRGIPAATQSVKGSTFSPINRLKILGDRSGETFPNRIDTLRNQPTPPPRTPIQSDKNTPVTSARKSPTGSPATQKASPARNLPLVDSTQRRWAAASLLLALLTSGLYVAVPIGARAGTELFFGFAGTGLALFCGLLPGRKKLLRIRRCAHWPILRSSVWEKGHSYLGLVGFLVLHCHGRFRMGGPLTAVLMVVLWAIIGSGLAELLFRHLLVLTKSAKEGKGLKAARIITIGHFVAQQVHVPLTFTLFVLGAVHAVMALFY